MLNIFKYALDTFITIWRIIITPRRFFRDLSASNEEKELLKLPIFCSIITMLASSAPSFIAPLLHEIFLPPVDILKNSARIFIFHLKLGMPFFLICIIGQIFTLTLLAFLLHALWKIFGSKESLGMSLISIYYTNIVFAIWIFSLIWELSVLLVFPIFAWEIYLVWIITREVHHIADDKIFRVKLGSILISIPFIAIYFSFSVVLFWKF